MPAKGLSPYQSQRQITIQLMPNDKPIVVTEKPAIWNEFNIYEFNPVTYCINCLRWALARLG